MAAARIARLTLFSGSHCSLCEVAKAELGKVKKQREFDLQVIDIHEKGQEKWKKKYIYWIPALHLDGEEIAKGRWNASTVLEALKQREAILDSQKPTDPADCFILDSAPSIYPSAVSLVYQHSCLYDRIPGIALGEEAHEFRPSSGQDLRLCFNCGSPDHAVASCSEPVNRQLVSLSRRLFNFLHPDLTGQEITRFYVAEGWKQQRLEWLGSYEPGVIGGPLLRDALGLQEGDPGNTVEWLRNMAYWGYPPGWVSHQDPRKLVRCRIAGNETGGHVSDPELESFTIFEGTGDDEEIDLRRSWAPPSATTFVGLEPTRWATYPNTYFSSTALFIYNGTLLDMAATSPPRVSVTFTPERAALWERILSGSLDTDRPPPWRMLGAFGSLGCFAVEEAAKDSVPPPPSIPPPPLPPFTPQKRLAIRRESTPSDDGIENRSMVDMDISDDSE